MFKKILIANRGEIALRVMRTCKEMGIRTVAVYSEGDRDSFHVHAADEAICIGPAPSTQSYLNMARIIAAAEVTNADAIHPGYGFLSEKEQFAQVCADCGITFIGPSPEAIRRMGDKAEARRTAIEAGCPIVPGVKDVVKDTAAALKEAKRIGFPIMVKATAGGGGRGMRLVREEKDFLTMVQTAQTEAGAAFGNPDVYFEKALISPKHIEIQVLGDGKGNVIHLGERDCSIQRRHQKLVEESPSAVMTPKLREKMGQAAVKAAKAVNYCGAGTIEFLLDADRENFYFMEMNTRIQVEHPVTELVTDVDLIRMQILVAAGEKMPLRQEDVKLRGHAIECRINAEDPAKNFMPCPGKLTDYLPPGGPGVRVDSHCYPGYMIPPYYDSMVAKLLVHAETRELATARMHRALSEYVVVGVKTTIPFHMEVMKNALWAKGTFGTDFLEHWKAKE